MGKVAVLSCSINTPTQKEARIIGNQGTIVIYEFSKDISAMLAVIGEEPVTVHSRLKTMAITIRQLPSWCTCMQEKPNASLCCWMRAWRS
ncbi:MAG: hypothetical protein ACSLEN_13970 [Candidatus Malihini olakiniferum]